jgi:hypothetical protein
MMAVTWYVLPRNTIERSEEETSVISIVIAAALSSVRGSKQQTTKNAAWRIIELKP